MCSTLQLLMNLAKGSEEKGGPLSVVRLLGFPYCEKSCVKFCMTVSAVFCCHSEGEWVFAECICYE